MAKIGLTDGFKLIPEGSHVFKISKVDYKEEYGKMEITLETVDGLKHIERFNLLRNDGEVNDAAMNAFSFFAKTALNDFKVTEIDEQDLVGHFIRCTARHEEVESTKYPGRTTIFVRLDDKKPADGFDDIDIPFDDEPKSKPAKKSSFDLKDLLN